MGDKEEKVFTVISRKLEALYNEAEAINNRLAVINLTLIGERNQEASELCDAKNYYVSDYMTILYNIKGINEQIFDNIKLLENEMDITETNK